MRKTNNERKSRKSLFVATALTILAIASVLLTATVLLGTSDGVVLIIILVVASVLLGTLYIRLLLSSSFRTSNYKGPNIESKKIFQSPLTVRDYSNKGTNDIAYPERGNDLRCSNSNKTVIQSLSEKNTEPETKDIKNKNEIKVSKSKMQNEKVEGIKIDSPVFNIDQKKPFSKINNDYLKKVTFESKEDRKNMTSLSSETPTHMIIKQNEKPEVLENTNSQQESMGLKKVTLRETNVNKKDIPEGCRNYFGYLWTLPKGTVTPDECYACARLIDCYKELAS